MNENEKKSRDWKAIVGGVILVIVLFMGVKLVFWGLEQIAPRSHTDGLQSISDSQGDPEASQEKAPAPSFCVHCGKGLPESFQWGQFCPWCGEKNEQ